MLIIGVMMFNKVQQCDDLDCKLAQLNLTNEEINNYLDKSDAYKDDIFEIRLDDKVMPASEKIK